MLQEKLTDGRRTKQEEITALEEKLNAMEISHGKILEEKMAAISRKQEKCTELQVSLKDYECKLDEVSVSQCSFSLEGVRNA